MKTAMLAAIIDTMEQGAFFVDNNQTLTMWNPAAETITGFSRSEMLGTSCQGMALNQIDKNGQPICDMRCPLCAAKGDDAARISETLLLLKSGKRMPVRLTAVPVFQHGQIVGALEMFSPTSGIQYSNSAIESLNSLAIYDKLTGLHNRTYLESHLHYKLNEYERYNSNFCVAFIDVDDFTVFNNQYGHTVGDLVLQSIGQSFKHSLRKGDILGRWGGEEFLGIFDSRHPAGADVLGKKLCALVEQSKIIHHGQTLSVSASVGITNAQPGDTPDSIVARADAMMYHRKANGKCGYTSDSILLSPVEESFPKS